MKIKLSGFREIPAIGCTLQPRAHVNGDVSLNFAIIVLTFTPTRNDSSRTITILTSCATSIWRPGFRSHVPLEIYRYACHPRHAYDMPAVADGAHSSPRRTITRWHKFEGRGGYTKRAYMARLHACLDINPRFDGIPRRGFVYDVITTLSDWFSVRSIERYPNCSPAGRTCCVLAYNTLPRACVERALSKRHQWPRLADRRNCVRPFVSRLREKNHPFADEHEGHSPP